MIKKTTKSHRAQIRSRIVLEVYEDILQKKAVRAETRERYYELLENNRIPKRDRYLVEN